MKSLIARILMPFLLLAQVGAGLSPGRVLCVASDCCAAEGAAHHAHHDHAHGVTPHGDHRHAGGCDRDATLAATIDNACDCHIHIVMPDDAGASRDRSGERIADPRLMQPALLDHIPAPLEVAADEPASAPPRRCWTPTDQSLAHASTRLLI